MEAFKGDYPSFIKFVTPEELKSNELNVPLNFYNEYGSMIPKSVQFQIPNESQIYVKFVGNKHSFTNVGQLYSEFKSRGRLILVLSYKGTGNFLVKVFNDGFFETEYNSTRSKTQAPVHAQDITNGVGWSFLSLGIGGVLKNGGAHIPARFIKWFGNKIPQSITLSLRNGEVMPGLFSAEDRRIKGLLPAVKKQYIKLWNILMFTYHGEGLFEVCIFQKDHVQKKFEEAAHVVGDTDIGKHHIQGYEVPMVLDRSSNGVYFATKLTLSNVNNSSHGVYIPRNTKAINRKLNAGDQFILRTEKGIWTTGLAISNGKPRISAGWNKFARDNKFQINNILHFTLVGEDFGRCIFDVVVEDNN